MIVSVYFDCGQNFEKTMQKLLDMTDAEISKIKPIAFTEEFKEEVSKVPQQVDLGSRFGIEEDKSDIMPSKSKFTFDDEPEDPKPE